MTNIEWSENQPPEWNPDIPPAAPKLPESEPDTPMSFGQVMSNSWDALSKNFSLILRTSGVGLAWYSIASVLIIVGANSWLTIDQQLIDVVIGANTDSEIPVELLLESGALNLLFSIAAVLVQFWMVAQIGNRILGREGANGWGRLLGANLLFAGLVMSALLIPAVGLGLSLESAPAISAGLGFLLLFLIGYLVYVSIGLIPLTGVVLAEEVGGLSALKRSLYLGRGYRFKMLMPLLVYSLFSGLISGAFTLFAYIPLGPMTQLLIYAIGLGISIAFAAAISAAVSIIIYQNQLRLPRK